VRQPHRAAGAAGSLVGLISPLPMVPMARPASGPSAPALLMALTTEASLAQAEALAEELLSRRLAACVSLQPVQARYHWQGTLERSNEVQLLIKSHPARLAELEQVVHQLHSYATPEWIHWPAGCSEAYASWLAGSCGLSPDGAPSGPADPPGDGAPAG
jgi:periplasmic divalent cation tolerance protein